MAGNTVEANRRPYQEGMVFRCNLDGSEFETLGWNFRNNWEVSVDSFGTLWQSDNDDDGNNNDDDSPQHDNNNYSQYSCNYIYEITPESGTAITTSAST